MPNISLTILLLFSISLFGCASSPNSSSERVAIESSSILEVHNSTIRGYLRVPEGAENYPAVVLMHGCDGLKDIIWRGLNNHANYLVAKGFVVLILDSFTSRGKSGGKVCRTETELGSARYYRQYDAYHALEFLQSKTFIDKDNIFLMGQSNGGSVALLVASGPDKSEFPSELRFRAIAAYYPWCSALKTHIVSPLLVLHAENDDWVPPRHCLEIKNSVTGAPYEVIVYEDAYHSFDLPMPTTSYLGFTVGGNSSAAKDSREKMLDWFIKHKQ